MPRETEWLASLVRPVLVVGNGALVSPVPEQEYASVIRFNNYVLGGLSGIKATHWVANGFRDIELRPLRPVLVPWSWELAKRRDRHWEGFEKRVGGGEVAYLENDQHIKVWFPEAVKKGNRFPTTGFCLLAWLRGNAVKFDIIGFDGMKTGHQGDLSHVHGHVKTRDKEAAILRSWNLRRRNV